MQSFESFYACCEGDHAVEANFLFCMKLTETLCNFEGPRQFQQTVSIWRSAALLFVLRRFRACRLVCAFKRCFELVGLVVTLIGRCKLVGLVVALVGRFELVGLVVAFVG